MINVFGLLHERGNGLYSEQNTSMPWEIMVTPHQATKTDNGLSTITGSHIFSIKGHYISGTWSEDGVTINSQSFYNVSFRGRHVLKQNIILKWHCNPLRKILTGYGEWSPSFNWLWRQEVFVKEYFAAEPMLLKSAWIQLVHHIPN